MLIISLHNNKHGRAYYCARTPTISKANYYKSIFDIVHTEILNKIFEISNEFDDFTLLNIITLNLNDIGKEAMKEMKETYYLHIENETKRIYNDKFNELKSNIKNYIDENVKQILNILNTEFEANYLNLSEKSILNVN